MKPDFGSFFNKDYNFTLRSNERINKIEKIGEKKINKFN